MSHRVTPHVAVRPFTHYDLLGDHGPGKYLSVPPGCIISFLGFGLANASQNNFGNIIAKFNTSEGSYASLIGLSSGPSNPKAQLRMIATQYTDRITGDRQQVLLERDLLFPNSNHGGAINLEGHRLHRVVPKVSNCFRVVTGIFNSLVKWHIIKDDGSIDKQRLIDLYQSDTTSIMLESLFRDPEWTIRSYDPDSIEAYPDLCFEAGLGIPVDPDPIVAGENTLHQPKLTASVQGTRRSGAQLSPTIVDLRAICRYLADVNAWTDDPGVCASGYSHRSSDARAWARFLLSVHNAGADSGFIPDDKLPIVIDRKLGGVARPVPRHLISALLERWNSPGRIFVQPFCPKPLVLEDLHPTGVRLIGDVLSDYEDHYLVNGTWNNPG